MKKKRKARDLMIESTGRAHRIQEEIRQLAEMQHNAMEMHLFEEAAIIEGNINRARDALRREIQTRQALRDPRFRRTFVSMVPDRPPSEFNFVSPGYLLGEDLPDSSMLTPNDIRGMMGEEPLDEAWTAQPSLMPPGHYSPRSDITPFPSTPISPSSTFEFKHSSPEPKIDDGKFDMVFWDEADAPTEEEKEYDKNRRKLELLELMVKLQNNTKPDMLWLI